MAREMELYFEEMQRGYAGIQADGDLAGPPATDPAPELVESNKT